MSKSIFSIETVELDEIACKLSREIDNLEVYYRDYNGNWYNIKDKRKHGRLVKKLAEVDKELSFRIRDGE